MLLKYEGKKTNLLSVIRALVAKMFRRLHEPLTSKQTNIHLCRQCDLTEG